MKIEHTTFAVPELAPELDGKVHINYDQMAGHCGILADQIAAQYAADSIGYDYLVTLPRGGFFPANVVSRHLGFEADRVLSIGITSYRGASEIAGELIIGQEVSKELVQDARCLLIDEVWETGKTITFAEGLLRGLGARMVRKAVTHYKPARSKVHPNTPDFYVAKTDAWIVYPWEEGRDQAPEPAVGLVTKQTPAQVRHVA